MGSVFVGSASVSNLPGMLTRGGVSTQTRREIDIHTEIQTFREKDRHTYRKTDKQGERQNIKKTK